MLVADGKGVAVVVAGAGVCEGVGVGTIVGGGVAVIVGGGATGAGLCGGGPPSRAWIRYRTVPPIIQ